MAGGWSGETKCPVLAVQKTQESPLAHVGDVFRVSPREVLVQTSEGAAPLRVVFGGSMDTAAQDQAALKVLEAAYHMDLAEPLERVVAALHALIHPE